MVETSGWLAHTTRAALSPWAATCSDEIPIREFPNGL
jgi:hypothetical protein